MHRIHLDISIRNQLINNPLDFVHFAFMVVPMLTFEDVWDTKPEGLLHWTLGWFKRICRPRERGEERCSSLKVFCLPHQVLMSQSKTAEVKLASQPPINSRHHDTRISVKIITAVNSTLTHTSLYMNTEALIQTFKCATSEFWTRWIFLMQHKK